MTDIPTNDTRAERCGQALQRYATANTDRCNLIDFLTDARHWCDRNGQSFAELDSIAERHYAAEIYEQTWR